MTSDGSIAGRGAEAVHDADVGIRGHIALAASMSSSVSVWLFRTRLEDLLPMLGAGSDERGALGGGVGEFGDRVAGRLGEG
jgi:hypothetical protein